MDIGEMVDTFVSDVAVTLVDAVAAALAGTVFELLPPWAITAIVYETVAFVDVVQPGGREFFFSGGNNCLLTGAFSTVETMREETLRAVDTVHMGTVGRGTLAGTFPLATTPVHAF